MTLQDYKAQWQQEEQHAFQGWDFSHLDGRWESEKLPWDYREIVLSHLKTLIGCLTWEPAGASSC